jgi:hypothetical protein
MYFIRPRKSYFRHRKEKLIFEKITMKHRMFYKKRVNPSLKNLLSKNKVLEVTKEKMEKKKSFSFVCGGKKISLLFKDEIAQLCLFTFLNGLSFDSFEDFFLYEIVKNIYSSSKRKNNQSKHGWFLH